MKAEPSLRRVRTKAGGRRGETEVKGLVTGRAGRAASPEKRAPAAGEALRWRLRNVGGGGSEPVSRGAGSALPAHACARPAPAADRPGLLTARRAPTVRTAERESHGPLLSPHTHTHTGARHCPSESLKVAGGHLFPQ